MRNNALDGIRAIAVILVFAAHGAGLGMGWTGVDLFFVLSGFLITTILRRDRLSESFWSSFYLKRAARILPALVVCFGWTALVCVIPWRIGLYYALFGANIAEARFHNPGKVLGVLWSLSVEEHFYFVWPCCVRLFTRRRLIQVLVSILCLEPFLRGAFTPLLGWWPIFCLTPFRLDGLAAGSLVAVLFEQELWMKRAKRLSMPVGYGLLALLVCLSLTHSFHREANFLPFNMFGYTLVTLVAAAWLSYTLTHTGSGHNRALSFPWLTKVGIMSYGIYLYHGIVLQMVANFEEAVHFPHLRTLLPVTIVAVLVISWLSFKFYELPILSWGHRQATLLRGRTRSSSLTVQLDD